MSPTTNGNKEMTVWKFHLIGDQEQSVEMPKGSEFLNLGLEKHKDHGIVPALWYLTDPNAEKEMRHFRIIGTGQTIPADAKYKYLHTFFSGPFVWHVFEKLS